MESFFGLPLSIENLLKLTEVNSPIPPTHWAAFLGVFEKLLEDVGATGENAQIALERYVKAIDECQARIDSLATGGRYNPNRSAAEQNLPDPLSELGRVYGSSGFEYVQVD